MAFMGGESFFLFFLFALLKERDIFRRPVSELNLPGCDFGGDRPTYPLNIVKYGSSCQKIEFPRSDQGPGSEGLPIPHNPTRDRTPTIVSCRLKNEPLTQCFNPTLACFMAELDPKPRSKKESRKTDSGGQEKKSAELKVQIEMINAVNQPFSDPCGGLTH
jgi:hypothetical protein